MTIINLSDIQNFIKAKKINTSEEVNIKNLKEKKLIRKNLNILKILGNESSFIWIYRHFN